MPSSKPKLVDSTPLSDFIRNASAAEKNKVYTEVLKKASEAQKELMDRVEARKGRR